MKKKDQLTPFFVSQLLVDYAKGKLSDERKKSLELVLEEHPDLKLELRNIEDRLHQLKAFEQTDVSLQWIEELSLPHPSLAQQIVSLEKRLAPRFWKTLPLLVIVIASALTLTVFKPWQFVNLDDIEVAEVQLSDDEERMEAALALSEKDIQGAMKEQPTEDKVEMAEASKEQSRDAETVTQVEPEPEPKPKEKPRKGELYRGFMTVDNLIAVADGTVQKIVDLKGRKAGQVPLGWERDEDERYFHFSLPERNKQALLDYLSNFSQVRLSSQEHPLVMPEGKIRIILVVKQNPQVEAPPKVPETEEESSSSEKEEPSQ